MSELAVRRDGASIIEAVITKGDLAKLTSVERTQYYNEVCRSVGLNPFTRPFEYISLSGKLTLYARREATDQLRRMNGISLEVISREVVGDILTVHVRATDKSGRKDEDFGSVSIKGLAGEALANANMKAITKGKRRVTLSISGLGFLDESEVEDIPAHERAAPANTRAQLDAFAGVPASPDIVDADTGEVRAKEASPELDAEQIHAAAREAALRGTEILRAHLRALLPEEREMLRDEIGTADEPGALLRAARLADADAIRERLRMASATGGEHRAKETSPEITTAPPATAVAGEAQLRPDPTGIPPAAAQPSPPARRAAAEPAGDYRSEPCSDPGPSELGPMPPPRSTIWGEESFGVPLTNRNGGPDWEKWAGDLVFLAEEASAAELEKLRADNKDTLQRLKVSDAVRYRSLMHDLDSSVGAPLRPGHSAESEA